MNLKLSLWTGVTKESLYYFTPSCLVSACTYLSLNTWHISPHWTLLHDTASNISTVPLTRYIYINIYSFKVSLMKLLCIWVSSFVFPLSNTFKNSLCLQMKSIEWKQKYGYPQDRQMTLGPHVHIALLMRSDDKWSLLTELNVSINSHSWSSVIARVCRTDILILWGLFHCVLAGWDTWLVTWQKRK